MDRLPETYALSSDFLDFASSDYDAISADRVSKMRAKTGPVVPSVIRERRTAGRTETWSRSCEDFIADTKVAPSSKSAETNGLRLVNIFSLICFTAVSNAGIGPGGRNLVRKCHSPNLA